MLRGCIPFQSEPDAAPARLIVKPTPGSQLALFATYQLSRITDREDAENRRHAEMNFGLNHLPSGRFAANGAWLAVQGWPITWAGQLASADRGPSGRVFALAGRLTRSARRLTRICHRLALGYPVQSRRCDHSTPSLTAPVRH